MPTHIVIDGIATDFTYDNKGNVTQIALPMNTVHQFTYTALNDLDTYTNPRNYVTDYNYTGVNLTEVISPVGATQLTLHPLWAGRDHNQPGGHSAVLCVRQLRQYQRYRRPVGNNYQCDLRFGGQVKNPRKPQ
ncbi:MAG: hypothetical protein IPN33_02320 [Saprospiraceae bacterium]|nr:hypothetical protein [Saprospiraceae bacterium]